MGKEATADPNREIGFGFVSCSCRACERAGEAKLRECVRHVSPPNAGASAAKITDSGAGWVSASFVAITMGVNDFSQISVDSAWVL